MNYQETLNKIENMMEVTGIRHYCSNVCKGACCSGCYATAKACHRNEGRRLACSVFLCNSLRELLFTKTLERLYVKMSSAIEDALSSALTIAESQKKGFAANLYFDPYTKGQMERFECSPEYIDKFISAVAGEKYRYHAKRSEIQNKISNIESMVGKAKRSWEPSGLKKKKVKKIKRVKKTKKVKKP